MYVVSLSYLLCSLIINMTRFVSFVCRLLGHIQWWTGRRHRRPLLCPVRPARPIPSGFDTGTGVTVKIAGDCIVLIPDNGEMKALREEIKQMKNMVKAVKEGVLRVL